MTKMQAFVTVLVIVFGTVLTRALPFLLFPERRETPPILQYMGTVLPCAMIAMLVIYCFKSIHFFSGTHGLPELIAGAFVVFFHHRFHNMILSIGGGTALYMVFCRLL